jgi:hypothetical protein
MSADPELVAGCKNGSCPKIFFYLGTRAAVQGTVNTPSAREVVAHGRAAVVEIPIAVFVEAMDELRERGVTVVASEASSGVVPRVRRIGEVVVVRGTRDTELTNKIEPGPGEAVVEVPVGALMASHDELVVV